ncbi:MAG: tetratricopeptide repeat protein [Phycisphaerae bacterium]|jgi:TolA-binding protein
MNLRAVSIKTVFVLATLFQYCALAADDAKSLYQQASGLEREGVFADAEALYQRVLTEYPNSPYAGPNYAGYRVKVIALRNAVSGNDIASARAIAADIGSLASSAQNKPIQLYWMASLFAANKFPEDAAVWYQRVLTDCPSSSYAGPDFAGFHAKEFALINALSGGDIASARAIAAEIGSLASSAQNKPVQLYWTAGQFVARRFPKDANVLHQQILTDYPDSSQALRIRIKKDCVGLLKDINSGNLAAAIEGTAAIKAKYADSVPEQTDMLFAIAETCYLAGLKTKQDEFFRQSAGLFENDIIGVVVSNSLKSSAQYMIGLNYWQLGEYFDAADAFTASIEADPNYMFAGNMHWLVADCYEKLKAAGDVNAPEADPIIEWGYQALFENYPKCGIIDYAAMRLSQINLDKGNEVAACGYYCWLLMKNDDPNRIGVVNAMFKKCQKCGGCGK